MAQDHKDIIDSGASMTTTPRAKYFKVTRWSPPLHIKTASGSVPVQAEGKLTLRGTQPVEVDALLADITHTLVAVCHFDLSGGAVLFQNGRSYILTQPIEFDFSTVMLTGTLRNGLYELDPPNDLDTLELPPDSPTAFAAVAQPLPTWHRRLGHLNYRNLLTLRNSATGFAVAGSTSTDHHCRACLTAKNHRLPSSKAPRIEGLAHVCIVTLMAHSPHPNHLDCATSWSFWTSSHPGLSRPP